MIRYIFKKHNRDHHEHEADEHPRDGVDAFLEAGGRGLGLELLGDGAGSYTLQ